MVGIKLNKGSDLLNIICLDTETTGLNHYDDEILQLSIIDGSGAILFSEYVKPVHHECWTDAEKVNHISPSMVKGCKPLLYYAHMIILLSMKIKSLLKLFQFLKVEIF